MLERLYRLYGAHEGWVRPVRRRHALRLDGLTAVLLAAGALLSVETSRSLGTLDTSQWGLTATYAWVVLPVVTLAVRRLYPLFTLGVAIVHYVLTAIFVPEVSPVFVLQIYYFFALFSAVAWAPRRRAAVLMTVVMASASVLWILAEVVLRDALDVLRTLPDLGVLSPPVAALLQVGVSTLTFFLASSLGGVTTWWSERRQDQARERGITIMEQTDRLRQRSVTEERLRIARELHDVVGHHVAVIGIQTSAARTVLHTEPQDAVEAMRQVEEASRAATRDLRLLLSALRLHPDTGQAVVPHGNLLAVPDLVQTYEALGLDVSYRVSGPVEEVPAAIGLAAYRVIQESLTNVCRHSEATTASVELDVEGDMLRVVVRDPGPARDDTSGSQLGLVGMRERVGLHGGVVDTGTTSEGGFEVQVEISQNGSHDDS